MKTKDDFIKSIYVNELNFKNIAEYGRINGTLLVELRRVLDEYASQQTAEKDREIERLKDDLFKAHVFISDLKIKIKEAIEVKQKTLLSPERYQGMQLVKDIIDTV